MLTSFIQPHAQSDNSTSNAQRLRQLHKQCSWTQTWAFYIFPRFGFRGEPDTILTAQPIVGEKSVNLQKLSSWIEEKLTQEFHRETVIPNMIDHRIPLMCGNYKDTRGYARKAKTFTQNVGVQTRESYS